MKPEIEQRAPPPIDVQRLNLLLVGLLLTALALYVVVQTMRGGTYALVSAAILIGGVIWIVGGRRIWWLPLPIATSIGGLIWVGFRIYSHEIALLMAMLALIPAVAINPKVMEQHRGRLPWTVYVLLFYLAAHLFGSLLINRYLGGSGMGNIVRTYTMALWPLIFIPFFFHFGDTRWIRFMLLITFLGLLFRVVVGVYSYFFPGFIFFRGINAFFLLSERGALELRDAPLRLLILCLGLFGVVRYFTTKAAILLSALLCTWFLLMGSGRVNVAMLGIVPFIWLLVQRRYFLMIGLIGLFGVAILLLNSNPEILYELPKGPQRALTVLLFEERLDIQAQLEGSNLWHKELLRVGKEKWLESWRTFMIGNRVHPFDYTMGGLRPDFYHSIHVAASIARYERALWTIISTTGLLGGLLYASVFFRLLKGPVLHILRNRVRTLNDAVYFSAFVHCTLFILFSPVSGAFPGIELMWAGIAFALHRDEHNNAATEAPAVSLRTPHTHRQVIR